MAKGRLERLADGVVEQVDRAFRVAKETVTGFGNDLEELAIQTEGKIEGFVDRVVEDDKLKELGKTFVDYSKQGRGRAKEALKIKYDSYQTMLNKKALVRPDVVGFWDGYVSALLDTKAERAPGSELYKVHAKYGKVFGYGSSVLLFTAELPLAALIGGMPLYSRAMKYFNKTLEEAQKTVANEKKKD